MSILNINKTSEKICPSQMFSPLEYTPNKFGIGLRIHADWDQIEDSRKRIEGSINVIIVFFISIIMIYTIGSHLQYIH